MNQSKKPPSLAALEAWRAAGGTAGPVLDPIAKSRTKPNSLSLAIRAKCYDCVGQDCDPNWRARVSSCPSSKCPLHGVRPYQEKAS